MRLLTATILLWTSATGGAGGAKGRGTGGANVESAAFVIRGQPRGGSRLGASSDEGQEVRKRRVLRRRVVADYILAANSNSTVLTVNDNGDLCRKRQASKQKRRGQTGTEVSRLMVRDLQPRTSNQRYSKLAYFAKRGMIPPLPSSGEDESPFSIPLEVVYTNNPIYIERWLADHVPSSCTSFLGFDTETVPTAPWMTTQALYDGPATIQLATPSSCLVAQLTRGRLDRQSAACRPLGALLQDESVIKVGVGIDDDVLELYRWNRRLRSRSRFDLGGIGSRSGNRVGLKWLAHAVLQVSLHKSKKLAVSNWSRVPLHNKQLAYGARDAWVAAAVMEKLSNSHGHLLGHAAVFQHLSSKERSMVELLERADRRREAKQRLREMGVRGRFTEEEEDDEKDNDESTKGEQGRLRAAPPKVSPEVEELLHVVRETAPDGMARFHPQELGL